MQVYFSVFTRATCGMPKMYKTKRRVVQSRRECLASGCDGRSLTGQLYGGTSEVGSFADIVDADIQRASPAAGLFTAFRPFFRFKVSVERGATAASVRVSERRVCQLRFQRFTTIYVFPLLFFSFFSLPYFTRGFIWGAGF